MVMMVSVSRFKANLGRFMRAVRGGGQVVITDRGEPVGKLVPVGPRGQAPFLEIAKPKDRSAPALGALKVRAIRVSGIDSVALLREDRSRR